MTRHASSKRLDEGVKYIDGIFERLGIEITNELAGNSDYALLNPLVNYAQSEIGTIMGDYKIENLTAVLASPDGVNLLRNSYMSSIKKSTIYKKMVEAKGDEIIDVMKSADEYTKVNGLESFKSVKLPDVVTAINNANKDIYDNLFS